MPKFKVQPLRETSDILHDLLIEAQKLIVLLDELQSLDERAGRLVCARISGRLDEAPFGEGMRKFGRDVKRTAKGSLETYSAVSQKVHELTRLLHGHAQVQNFDRRFHDLQDTLARKYPASASAVAKYGNFAKAHPVCQVFVLALLAAAAALGTGHLVSTVVIMMMLRIGNEILKNADLHTAS